AADNQEHGLIDNWLRHIKDVYHRYRDELDRLAPDQRCRRLCEINVAEQAANVCYTTIVQSAWNRGQPLAVYGFIYSLQDGLLRDLGIRVTKLDEVPTVYSVSYAAAAR
ncbi:MAG TPA: carbonic anhydrase, partial [Terriglobales bacterium]|nr:carbonic anhydrase [Terriglobales bacterium]